MNYHLHMVPEVPEAAPVTTGDEVLYVLRESNSGRSFWPSDDFSFVTATQEFQRTIAELGRVVEIAAYDALTGSADRHWLMVALQSNGGLFPPVVPIR